MNFEGVVPDGHFFDGQILDKTREWCGSFCLFKLVYSPGPLTIQSKIFLDRQTDGFDCMSSEWFKNLFKRAFPYSLQMAVHLFFPLHTQRCKISISFSLHREQISVRDRWYLNVRQLEVLEVVTGTCFRLFGGFDCKPINHSYLQELAVGLRKIPHLHKGHP